MKLVLTNEFANILLLINGLAILLYFGAKKKHRQRAIKFGNYETLEKVAGKNFLKSSSIVLLFRILALTTIIIGISSPVLIQEVPSSKSDYVMTIDSSASMLASDLDPNRFEAAKSISTEFIQRTGPETRIGAISFSGKVTKEQELTGEKEQIISSIKNISVGQKAGTAIGDALNTATGMLVGVNKSKSIILITDGRNNVGSSINESLKFAIRQNVTIYTIGIGKNNTSSRDETEVVNGTRAGFPNLNQGQLRHIANTTGGEFMAVTNNSQFRSALLEVDVQKQKTELSTYFIILGAVLLLIEWLLATTRYSVIP